MQKAYYHLTNVNITPMSCTPVRSWDIVTPLEKMTYSPSEKYLNPIPMISTQLFVSSSLLL